MFKSKIFKIDLAILIIGVFLVFFTQQDETPKVVTTIVLILFSFYFFPSKLLMFKENKFKTISNIIISATFAIGVIFLFKEVRVLGIIFSFLNIGYLLYLGYFVSNEKLGNNIYKSIIVLHFLSFFMTL